MRLIFILFCFLSFLSAQAKFYAVFPNQKDNVFWHSVAEVFEEVTQKLGVESEVILAEANRFSYVSKVEEVLNTMTKDDVIFCLFFFNRLTNIIKKGLDEGKKIVIFNTKVSEDEFSVLKKHANYANLFSFFPDDVFVGNTLLSSLVQKHREDFSLEKEPLNIFMISGKGDSTPSIDREVGALKYLAFDKRVNLLQKVPGLWEKKYAYEVTKLALVRYPKIDIIWTASDSMAIGAHEALVEAKKDKIITLGGVDWSMDGINLAQSTPRFLSIGGHFLEIGKAVLLVHGYLNNEFSRDFLEKQKLFQNFDLVAQKNLASKRNVLEASWRKKLSLKEYSDLLLKKSN